MRATVECGWPQGLAGLVFSGPSRYVSLAAPDSLAAFPGRLRDMSIDRQIRKARARLFLDPTLDPNSTARDIIRRNAAAWACVENAGIVDRSALDITGRYQRRRLTKPLLYH